MIKEEIEWCKQHCQIETAWLFSEIFWRLISATDIFLLIIPWNKLRPHPGFIDLDGHIGPDVPVLTAVVEMKEVRENRYKIYNVERFLYEILLLGTADEP